MKTNLRLLWFAVFGFTLSAFAQTAPTDTKDPFSFVPSPSQSSSSPFPRLAASYAGWWKETLPQFGNRVVSNKNSMVITFQDEKGAKGTYTSYATSSDPCWSFVDAPMELRWRNSTTVTLIAKHPVEGCKTRQFNLTWELSGRLLWTSSNGLGSTYFDPE